MDGSMAGTVVTCAEASAHIRLIKTGSKIRLISDALGWASRHGRHDPRILNLQNCDANKAGVLRKELDVCRKEPHVHLRRYKSDMNGSAKLPSGPHSEVLCDAAGRILSETMPSAKSDVKKNLAVVSFGL